MTAHKNIFQTSDFIVYSSILVSLILEWFIPTNLNIPKTISIGIGILLIIISWTIIFTTKYQFKKSNQKTGPNNETMVIIETGLFKYSRNPLYFGMLFLSPALGFIFNSVWLLFALLPIVFLIHHFLIIPEEKYLSKKFGTAYIEYSKRVRRWM